MTFTREAGEVVVMMRWRMGEMCGKNEEENEWKETSVFVYTYMCGKRSIGERKQR